MPRTTKPSKLLKPTIYRHTSHAEWGLGMIVEENPNKVYLAFEDGGRRPFVNAPRFRELLVMVEMATESTEQIVAKIAKNGAKPSTKAAEKKPKKKAVEEEEEAVEASVEEGGEEDEEEDDK